jgi:hypothetical protein
MGRVVPSRAFRKRDFHRRWLTIHVALWLALLVGAFMINRSYTPDTFWMQWVALVAGIALSIHGVIFARSTLATMGGAKD